MASMFALAVLKTAGLAELRVAITVTTGRLSRGTSKNSFVLVESAAALKYNVQISATSSYLEPNSVNQVSDVKNRNSNQKTDFKFFWNQNQIENGAGRTALIEREKETKGQPTSRRSRLHGVGVPRAQERRRSGGLAELCGTEEADWEDFVISKVRGILALITQILRRSR
ncbi:hypothetical protein KSP40_PGU020557 [Platanthera guangdongensis]|uniref:Uncharacterized protein n=1 Tax=Platanthera guangdongensis TaxID=2320717 RepID=A0ABR2MIZ9_9ASPA